MKKPPLLYSLAAMTLLGARDPPALPHAAGRSAHTPPPCRREGPRAASHEDHAEPWGRQERPGQRPALMPGRTRTQRLGKRAVRGAPLDNLKRELSFNVALRHPIRAEYHHSTCHINQIFCIIFSD